MKKIQNHFTREGSKHSEVIVEKRKALARELEKEYPGFGFFRIYDDYLSQKELKRQKSLEKSDNFEANCARIFSNAQYNTNQNIIDGSENAI